MDKKPFFLYFGILFVSAAALGFEISLVRILSISQWHHFAYMVISIALLGIGAGGSFLFLFPRMLDVAIQKSLSVISFLFCLSTILSYVIINLIPFDPFRLAWDMKQLIYIFYYYLILSIPFFFNGLILALLFRQMPEKAGRLYFYNLLGSSLGCLVIPFLFSFLEGAGVIAFVSLTGGIACFFFSYHLSRTYKITASVMIAILLSFLAIRPSFFEISISPYKALKISLSYKDSEILKTYWNSFSRVDVIKSPAVRYAPGLSLKYKKALPQQIGITIDGDNLNSITRFDGKKESLEFSDYLPSALVYRLKKAEKLLIINSNGGIDVLGGLYHEIPSIDALEVNPLIIRSVKDDFPVFSGNIYHKVNIINEEGRSFIRKTKKNYDIIQMSLSDNPSAASTGLYSLKESYLYTVEAFKDFYRHLTPEGVFTVTRYLIPPPREGARLVSVAKKALEEMDIKDPQNHMALIRSWGTITFLLKKNGFNSSDIKIIKDFCNKRGFDTVYYPGMNESEANQFNRFERPYYFRIISDILKDNNQDAQYIFDLSAVTDNNPFFFHFFKWNKIFETYRLMGEKWQLFLEGGYILPVILVQSLFVGILLILLPFFISKGKGVISFFNGHVFIYFTALGLGFMFIEIILIEKFILFFGHPIFSLSIVLFSILFFSGLGSYLSEMSLSKQNGPDFSIKNVLIVRLIFLILMICLYWLFLSSLLRLFLGYGNLIKSISAVIIIAPLGVLMGIPFPLGIRLISLKNRDLIPFAFAVNGVFSVLGSILCMTLAVSLGFQTILLFSAFAYSLALVSTIKTD